MVEALLTPTDTFSSWQAAPPQPLLWETLVGYHRAHQGRSSLSGHTAHRRFSRKAIIRLLTRKGINLPRKIPEQDLKALQWHISSSDGCAQDYQRLLVSLLCGKNPVQKKASLPEASLPSLIQQAFFQQWEQIASASTFRQFGPTNCSSAEQSSLHPIHALKSMDAGVALSPFWPLSLKNSKDSCTETSCRHSL